LCFYAYWGRIPPGNDRLRTTRKLPLIKFGEA
jgi:hypothetical protein